MEYLDIYDENGNYLGKETRSNVHTNALWHKTVHCWLYDKLGNVYFQIRADNQKFYTTASGHVAAGETIREAFGREIREEIGITLDYEKAELVEVVKFVMDRENADGSYFRDRAFANVYAYLIDDLSSLNCDLEEVLGLVKVNSKDAISLFKGECDSIHAVILENTSMIEKQVGLDEFLVNKGETAILKYGNVLEFVVEHTK